MGSKSKPSVERERPSVCGAILVSRPGATRFDVLKKLAVMK
jgi:hypothetical protein